MSAEPRVEIFGNTSCVYCMAARTLFTRKGVPFRDIIVSGDPDQLALMRERSGRDSVPQVFIDGEHVGGFDEVDALEKSGRLDKLLAAR